MNLKEKAKNLKLHIPVIFLCLKSKETPLAAKISAGVTIAYFLSPVDLIPDFIPVLGYLDDMIILPLLIALTIKLIPKETMEKYKKEAESRGEAGIAKKWYFAVPVIIIWMSILFIIIKAVIL